MPAKKPPSRSRKALTAEDFHALRGGGRALFLVPRAGFALNRELDDFLAFVVRCFPLSVGVGEPFVDPEGVVDHDDLDRAHRALRDFLGGLGYQLPRAVHEASAIDFAWPRWVPIGDNPRERLEQLDRLERDLQTLVAALSSVEVPSIAKLLRDDDAGRRRLDELVLDFLRRAVEAPSMAPDDHARGGYIFNMLRLVPTVDWPEDLAAEADALRKQLPVDESPLIITADGAPSPWW